MGSSKSNLGNKSPKVYAASSSLSSERSSSRNTYTKTKKSPQQLFQGNSCFIYEINQMRLQNQPLVYSNYAPAGSQSPNPANFGSNQNAISF